MKILSENLQEMFPYSCRKGHVPSRKSQKSFRIPNHPVKNQKLKQGCDSSIIILFTLNMVIYCMLLLISLFLFSFYLGFPKGGPKVKTTLCYFFFLRSQIAVWALKCMHTFLIRGRVI